MQRTVGWIDVGELGLPGPRRLPLVGYEGVGSGPCVLLTANVHGDECTGVHALHALDERLAKTRVCGRVFLAPTLNPTGLAAGTRTVPIDSGDLNRSFPGSPDGSRTERLARLIWLRISRLSPSLVIDLHADSLAAMPYAIVDRAVARSGPARAEMDVLLDTHASAAGLTVLREYPDEAYLRFGLDRSLAGAVVNRLGVPAVTVEAGPRRFGDLQAVHTMEQAVWGVLAHVGAVPGDTIAHPSRIEGGPWRRAGAPRPRAEGVWLPALRPGQRFARGDVLGRVRGLAGELRDEVRATDDGLVVSWAETSWVGPDRSVIGTVGVRDL